MTAAAPPALTVVYDLTDPGAWDAACDHAMIWGRLYCQIEHLDNDHIAVLFNPAPDERWRGFERVRLEWLLQEMR